MNKMQHTPGPWKVNYRRVTPVNGRQDGNDDICHVYGDQDANARLIAAAPDLLAACQRAYECCYDKSSEDGIALKLTINKATGIEQ